MTHHWDEFSKSLAQPLPRRESLRRLGLVVAGAVLSPLGLASAAGAPKGPKAKDPCTTLCKCRRKADQNQCLAACRACADAGGTLGGNCGNYFCCSSGLSACGSYCADLANDPYNCGACSYVCRYPGPYENGACVDGQCVYECSDGAVRCSGTCTSLSWDPYNCGACGNACGQPGPNEYAACVDGRCEYACYEGAVYCDRTCTFLDSDPANCGACGNVCSASTPYCSYGVCVAGDEPCPGGATRCNGVCTNINFDNLNCGGCGIRCGEGQICSGGLCQFPF